MYAFFVYVAMFAYTKKNFSSIHIIFICCLPVYHFTFTYEQAKKDE